MFVLGLLTCIALRAFSAQAKVVETFDECSEFFYKDTEPLFFISKEMDQNAKKICQRLENTEQTRVFDDDDRFHFGYYATLYSVLHRIPLYSAYTLERSCSDTTGRTNTWHLEPKLSELHSPIDYMVPENQNNQDTLKGNQAISSDYRDTGYDRGHLNPNSFQCDEGRTATFTLTNAAPMDACFNRIQWKNWERILKSFLTEKLNSDRSATAYIVTGTVPGNLRIPQREKPEDSNRVTVPSHIWTAVCYKHHNDDESVSFGYIGENLPGGKVNLMSVSQLNNRLNQLYKDNNNKSPNIKIFDKHCFEHNVKLNEVKKAFQKLINLPLNQGVQATPDVQNTINALQSISTDSLSPGESVEVTDMSVKLTFNSRRAYSTVTENLKVSTGSACSITNYGQESVECQLGSKKRKIAADGSPRLSISDSGSCCRCYTGGETRSRPWLRRRTGRDKFQ